MKIGLSQGSGGDATSKLISEVFVREFNNEYLDRMGDSAVLPGNDKVAFTTDSFVVRPLVFDGGDIGRLSVCGTVNDLLMIGAVPRYLTAAFVLEEGLDVDLLRRIVRSMAETAKEAGVLIVTGDTKVIERCKGGDEPGIIINTSGIGFIAEGVDIGPHRIKTGDVIILSGNLGDHHAAILKERLNIKNDLIESDNAPLCDMVRSLMEGGARIHAMRDVTRGGLGTVLNEFVSASGKNISINEESIPESDAVKGFSSLLGLDLLYMGNEGKMACAVEAEDAEKALELIRSSKYGENAAIIGTVGESGDHPALVLKTSVGGERIVGPMYGEGLPRIC